MSSLDNREVQSTKETINSVSVPFLVASIGSIIGCTASFLVCRKFPSLWLSPEDAAVAAGCLCASFIGGSVNFFVTANVIGDSGSISSLLSSMAAADLLVMAAYFSIMAASLKSNFLSKIFGGSSNASKGASEDQNERKDKSNRTVKSHAGNSKVLGTKALATVVVSALAFSIVKISTHIEKMAASIIPGLACAIIAILAPAAQRFLFSKKNNGLVREIQNVASPLSDVCFLLLFASIGTSANLEEALLQGPACLSFSILALAVHIIAVVGGSLQVKKWLRLNFVLEDVLVASNAAIGGPSTAAAFAGRMKGSRQRGLTMAGTVMGIIGYAVGTTVGVTLFRILQKFVLS